MAFNSKGIDIIINGDASGFDKEIRKIKSSVQGIDQEMGKLERTMKKNGDSWGTFAARQDLLKSKFKNLKQQMNLTKDAISQQKDKVKQLTDVFGENSKEVEGAKQKLSYLRAEYAYMKSELKGVNDQLITGNSLFNAAYYGLDKMAGAAQRAYTKLRPISTLAFAGIAGATKETMDFETALTGVLKTVDATPEQIEKIDDGLKNLATTTASSYEDIAKFAELGGQMGIDPENIVEFSKVITMLSDTTNIIGEDAAQTIAKFANIMSDSKGEDGKVMMDYYSRLGSTIVDLGNNFATTESDIMNLSSRLAAAGDQIGMSTPQVLALSTALSSMGLRTDEAGGSVSKFMQTMALDVANNGESLEAYASISGQTIEQFKKSWGEDAPAAFLRFLEGISKAEDGDERLQKLAEAGLTDSIRVARSFGALTANVDLYKDALNLAGNAWEENSAMEEEANKRYATLAATLSQAKEAIKQAANELGKAFAPTLKKAAEEVKKFAKNFAKAPQYVKDFAAKALLGTAALAPMAKGLNLVSEGGKSVIKSVGDMVRNFDPLKAGIAAVAVAVTAAVVSHRQWVDSLKEARKESDEHYRSSVNLLDVSKEQISSAQDQIKTADDLVASYLSQEQQAERLIGKIGDLLGQEQLSNREKDNMRWYIEQLNELYPNLGLKYDENTGKLTNNTDEVINNTEELKKNTEEVFKNARQKALAAAQSEYMEAAFKSKMALSGLTEEMKYYKAEVDQLTEKQKELADAGQWNTEETNKVAEALIVAKEHYAELSQEVTAASDAFMDSNIQMAKSWAIAEDGSMAFTDTLKNQFKDLTKEAGDTALKIPQTMADNIANGQGNITEVCQLLGTMITFQEGLDSAGYYGTNIPLELVNALLENATDIAEVVHILNTMIEFSEAMDAAGFGGFTVTEAMAKGILDGSINVEQAFDKMWSDKSYNIYYDNAGKQSGEGYIKAAGKTFTDDSTVKSAAGKVAKQSTEKFKEESKIADETKKEVDDAKTEMTNADLPGKATSIASSMSTNFANNLDLTTAARVQAASVAAVLNRLKSLYQELNNTTISPKVSQPSTKIVSTTRGPQRAPAKRTMFAASANLYTAASANLYTAASANLYTAPSLTDSVTSDGIGGTAQMYSMSKMMESVTRKLNNLSNLVDVSGIRSDLKTIAKNQNQQANVYLGQERVGNMTYEYGNKRRAFDDFMDAALAGGTL